MNLNKYMLALTCTLTAVAHAETNFYVLGSAGVARSELKKNDLIDSSLTVDSSKIDRTDVGYKAQVGYQLMQNLAIEGGYVNLGEYTYKANFTDSTVTPSTTGDAKVKWKAKGWNIDVVGMVPFNDKFSVLAKLGAIQAKVKTSGHVTNGGVTDSGSSSASGLSPVFGIGAQYKIIDNLLIRVEAESYGSVGDNDKTGKGDVYLLSAGVGYKF